MAKVFFLLFKLNIMIPGLHLYFELIDDTTISMSSFHARLPNHIGQERHLGVPKCCDISIIPFECVYESIASVGETGV